MVGKKEISPKELDTLLCQHVQEEEKGWEADQAVKVSLQTKFEC